MNPYVGQLILDCGGACLLDLLHVYTLKIHSRLNLALPFPQDATVGGLNLHVVMEAWKQESFHQDLTKTDIFLEKELLMIESLIDVLLLITKCSSPPLPNHPCQVLGSKNRASAETDRQVLQQGYRQQLEKMLDPTRRLLRMCVYEGGVIEAAATWLLMPLPAIQVISQPKCN